MGRVCRILQHLASVQWGPGRPLGEAQPVLMVLVLLGVLGLELGRWIPGQCGGIAEPLLSRMTEVMVQVTQVLMGTVHKVTVHGVPACGQRPVNSDCYFGSRLCFPMLIWIYPASLVTSTGREGFLVPGTGAASRECSAPVLGPVSQRRDEVGMESSSPS